MEAPSPLLPEIPQLSFIADSIVLGGGKRPGTSTFARWDRAGDNRNVISAASACGKPDPKTRRPKWAVL